MNNKFFIISLTYIKSIEQIDKYRDKHMEFLENCYNENIFIMSGPKVPRNGGLIIALSSSKEELENILSNDPFYNQQLASFEITEFIPTKFDKSLKEFITNFIK